MSELACTFEEFKRRCKELIDAAPSLDDEGFENGVKMLNLSYLNIEGTDLEIYMASVAWRITLKQTKALERLGTE